MIPGSFDYHRPKSVADAVALLVKLGEDARPLAGGHSLIPMMKTFARSQMNVEPSGRLRTIWKTSPAVTMELPI